ncbi:hypothetical protein [Brucella thiophenivorans]|uniref:hypothetical protein n=1 Tax=Brucella thiophenivorans TaxID=571255 RepID=UPI00117C9A2A|nr:hypothetical protein [Brucella thiophenivorans]
MKLVIVLFSALLTILTTPHSFSQSGADGGNGGDGPNSDGGNSIGTMPGCDGGTNPSADGKFYLPGTQEKCNPSDYDRKKLDHK